MPQGQQVQAVDAETPTLTYDQDNFAKSTDITRGIPAWLSEHLARVFRQTLMGPKAAGSLCGNQFVGIYCTHR